MTLCLLLKTTGGRRMKSDEGRARMVKTWWCPSDSSACEELGCRADGTEGRGRVRGGEDQGGDVEKKGSTTCHH